MVDIHFLGTGGAWGLPELNCHCRICKKMRQKGEKRERTAILLWGRTTLLVDCGPDIRTQLSRHEVRKIDAVLITHEHGDHYMGLDELLAYKRSSSKEEFRPIPVYLTPRSWEVIGPRFGYLAQMKVIEVHTVDPGQWFQSGDFNVMGFGTDHGSFAKGSVGYIIRFTDQRGRPVRLVYTSDYVRFSEWLPDMVGADYLVIQSFWLNEPVSNRPHHMSFQRAIGFIERLQPRKETFLVHIGDADMVKDDPANCMAKKYMAKDPLKQPSGAGPYPVPVDQASWQETVERIMADRGLAYAVTVAYDDLCLRV